MKTLKKNKGVSLLELMVALAIGLILLLALGAVYVTANNNSKQRSTDDQLDEIARQVFERIGTDISQAGFVDMLDKNNANTTIAAAVGDPNEASVQRNLGRLTNSGQAVQTLFEAVSGQPGLEGTDNTLTVRYQAIASGNSTASGLYNRADATARNSRAANSGIAMDCSGTQLQGPAQGTVATFNNLVITNTYSTANDNLECRGSNSVNGNGNHVVTSGVHALHFRYLVTGPASSADSTLTNSQSGLYTAALQSAAGVTASTLGWAGVTGVEVCVIAAASPTNGQRQLENTDLQPTIPSCVPNAASADGYAAGAARAAGDTKLYRRYVKIFNIPNALYLKL